MIEGKRVAILVEVNLDAIPGHFDNVQDYIKLLESYLNQVVPHYEPTVREIIDYPEPRASRR
jgi:hypothetical protein